MIILNILVTSLCVQQLTGIQIYISTAPLTSHYCTVHIGCEYLFLLLIYERACALTSYKPWLDFIFKKLPSVLIVMIADQIIK